jgi:hypothetical protein
MLDAPLGTFDFLMIHQNLLERGKLPEIINRGSKIMQLTYGKNKKLIDSYNFLQCGLDVSYYDRFNVTPNLLL